MTGSQAPQRALSRLVRLGLRTERLAALTAPAGLLDDPLAGLTARPLDESALEAVLQRLDGSAETTAGTASGSAAARFRKGSAVRGGRARRVSNALPSRLAAGGLPPGAGHEPLRTRSSSLAGRWVRPAAPHKPSGSSPAAGPAAVEGQRESSALVRAAGRVAGGAAAVATRVAAEWTPDELAVVVENGSALLQAALARAVVQPVDAGEPSHGRVRRSEPGGSLTSGPSLEDALAPRAGAVQAQAEPIRQPFARGGGEQPTGLAGVAGGVEHGGEPDSALHLPGSGSGGLAELVRRWESVHGRDDEAPAVRSGGEPDVGAGIEAEDALARALERVLAAELRRSGIEVDAG